LDGPFYVIGLPFGTALLIETPSPSVSFKIDATPPTLKFLPPNPAPNAVGWNNTDVLFPFAMSDNLSSIASWTPRRLLLTSEGTSVTGNVTVTDVAGNSAIVAASVGSRQTRGGLSMESRRLFVCLLLFLASIRAVAASAPVLTTPITAAELPARLDDQTFWHMIDDFSEPGGEFFSDNFVSNERKFQHVIPALQKKTKPGRAYLGVGPDQNFTYISATRPGIAFIIDIRRQNLIQHLMYKALFELSEDRAGFLSQLFSRPRPKDVKPDSTANELLAAIDEAAAENGMFQATLSAMKQLLAKKHGFGLTDADETTLGYVFGTFFREGPQIRYDSRPIRFGVYRPSPTYADLMTETDGSDNRSYLASEENFRLIQSLEKRNLVVPLVGNFAGEKTIRRVGQYLKEQNASVEVFYLSNVEQYLFRQGDDWSRFYANVATLPLNSASTFIRSFFYSTTNAMLRAGSIDQPASMLCSIKDVLSAFSAGGIRRYYDIIEMSY
jgi:hypothetical protein